MSRMENLEQHLAQLNAIGIALSCERDLKSLLEKILTEARSFTRAEAGTLYLAEEDALRFVVSQNDVLSNSAGGDSASVWFDGEQLPLSKQSMAGYVGLTGEVLNLEDAYRIPPAAPYRFNPDFDRQNDYRTQSMMLVPMRAADERIVGVLQLINARGNGGDVIAFDSRYEDLVMSLASQAAVAVCNVRLTEELKRAYLDTILRLAVAVEYRDDDTAEHIRRMANYSVLIADELGFPPERLEMLHYAAPMHDIGKVSIPDAILLKTGGLTDAEYDEMKRHTEIGAQILAGSQSPVVQMSAEVALTHHEKFDGTGYPGGLSGQRIPLEGRVVALADVFDALSSVRCYKPAFPLEKCVDIIRNERGRHFDPLVVDAFLRRLDDVPKIRENRLPQVPGLSGSEVLGNPV